ncbi:hypothetical protein [Maricaulis salignorans]|uniref:hypothetical protein n=1 Tax=Maricaulis salignorans TaxID=144026 RepID=UPI003A946483
MTGTHARLAIRADGDSRLGFGHVIRCAALAQALLDAGHALIWFSQTPHAIPASLASRIEVRPIPAGGDTDGSLLPALTDARIDGLIADWQITDAPLCAQLRRAGFWLALVGNHHSNAEADLYIRQGFEPTQTGALMQVCDGREHILLAPDYASRPPRTIRPQAQRLLISLGGSETPVLEAVLAALDNLPELEGVMIDIKRAAPGTTALPEAGLLAELCAADIAILGAGTTLHEAAATGLAAIALPIAANQRERARQFAALGLGLSLDPTATGFAEDLRQALRGLLEAPARRQALARASEAAVDGRGADRVASRISYLVSATQTQLNSTISRTAAGPAA